MTDMVLRVGIIGCGEAAQALHIPSLLSLSKHFEIVACADADADLSYRVAGSVGARSMPVADLIGAETVDVVLIASPHAVHAAQAVSACRAGHRAVLLEKPPATSTVEARHIAAASAETGVPVICAYPHVFDTAVTRARLEVQGQAQSGEFWCRIGPNRLYTSHVLETVSAQGDPSIPALANRKAAAVALLGPEVTPFEVLIHGWVMGLSIHDIPVLRRILGEPQGVIHAGARELPEGRLGFDAVLSLPGGHRALMMVELLDHMQTDWGFAVRASGKSVRVDYPTTYAVTAPSTCTVTHESGGMTARIAFGDRYESGFRREWLHLHDVVVRGEQPETPIADAVEDLLIAEEIVRKITGRG
jgi:predicted dehydrogenase